MAPFASLNGFWLVPLAVNSACLIGTLLVVQRLLFSRFKAGQLSSWLLASFLAFCLNIYGLVFTGMEHSLQVLLAAIIADSVTRRKVNILLWVSLLILPLIRYEGLAISAPVLFYLACQGRATRSKSLATGLLLAIGLLSFSAFLGSLGLGYLPSSVFAKQSATTADSAFSLFEIMAQTAIENIRSRPTFTIYFIATISGFLAWSTCRARVLILLGGPAILHLCLGRNGWLGRYEVSILLYILIVSADLLAERAGLHIEQMIASSVVHASRTSRLVKSSILFIILVIFAAHTKGLWQ